MADTLIFKVVDIDLHGKRPAHIFLIDDLYRRTVFTGAVTVEYQRLVGYFQCVLGIMGVHYGRYATLFRKVFNGIKDYELVPLDESVKGDPLVEAELSKYRNLVDEEYFSQYGYSVSDTVVENQITFPESSKIGLTQGEEPLGNLLADSYKYAIMQAEKGSVKAMRRAALLQEK